MNKISIPKSTYFQDRLSERPLFVKEGKWYFRNVDRYADTTDSFDRVKLFFKSYPRLYYWGVWLVSPVFISHIPLKRFFAGRHGPVLNLGSGNEPVSPAVVNVDRMDYDLVDIVCDIHNLPFKSNSIGAIMSNAVLEHVQEPQKVLKEAFRVLEPGGMILSIIPFMQPFHAYPDDYKRFTLPGIQYLHKYFELLESGVYSGPISGLLWVFQETIASILSLGIPQ
jgi:SAM-dependent methyltransferase